MPVVESLLRSLVGGARRGVESLLEARRAAPDRAPTGARALRVTRVERETDDAVTVHFEPVAGARLAYDAGQFLTFLLRIDGELVRRSYSLSSAPEDGPAASITVKRVAGGRASSFVNDRVRPGDVLHALGPFGAFTLPARPAPDARPTFLAGGSGVTPVLGMVASLLRRAPDARVDVFVGDRRLRDAIGRTRLARLAAAHPGLRVEHVLEQPDDGSGCEPGRLDGERALRCVGGVADRSFYVCGPAPMMDSVLAALRAAGVPDARVRTERFASPPPAPPGPAPAAGGHTLEFVRAGRTVVAAPGATLLAAGRAAGVAMDSGCEVGECGLCRLRMVRGCVDAPETPGLDAAEREGGYVLPCVTRPTGPVVLDG